MLDAQDFDFLRLEAEVAKLRKELAVERMAKDVLKRTCPANGLSWSAYGIRHGRSVKLVGHWQGYDGRN